MKALILGDVHGCWGDLNIVIARALRDHTDITHLIQVGDFGYAWPGGKPFSFLPTFMEDDLLEMANSLPFHWIDGNHENHDQLDRDQGASQPGMIYQPRGSILEIEDKRIMFFGGASSIDKAHRIEGKSWWPQESITYAQTLAALENKEQIDLIISHEFPLAFPYRSYKDDFGKADKQALDALRERFKPACWVFGHHHDYRTSTTEGTQWACAPIIDAKQAIIWDGDSLSLYGAEKRGSRGRKRGWNTDIYHG